MRIAWSKPPDVPLAAGLSVDVTVHAGVITRADALRIETALANARQQEIQVDAQEASAQLASVRDQVSVDVAARLAETRAAASAVGVARTAIASAEEGYRVTDALVKAGSATTTDLLDAQAALTTARSNLARARYGYAATRVSLARATGEL